MTSQHSCLQLYMEIYTEKDSRYYKLKIFEDIDAYNLI